MEASKNPWFDVIGSVRVGGGKWRPERELLEVATGLAVKVEFCDFDLTGEPDDRRQITADRSTGESRRR